MIRVPKIEVGILLAAHTYSRRVGPNITGVAPVCDHQALAVLVDEHRAIVDAVDLEMVRRFEMAEGLEVRAPQALIVEHAGGVGIALEVNELVIGRFEIGLVIFRPRQLPANRWTARRRREAGRGQEKLAGRP